MVFDWLLEGNLKEENENKIYYRKVVEFEVEIS